MTAVTVGLAGALLLGQHSSLVVLQSAQAQEAAGAESMRSYPPDTTHYIRSLVAEDLAPMGRPALGARAQSWDPKAVQILGADPGIFIVDVVVNNTDPNLAINDTPNDGETSIAVNPEDPDEIMISAFSGGFNNAPIYHSTDGGLSWTREPRVPKAPGWRGGCPCDWTWDWGLSDELSGTILDQSDLGNDGDGDTFDGNIVSLTTTDPTDTPSYQYYEPTPGYAEETNINVASSYGNSDQPWLLVNMDPTSPGQENVYVAYDDFSGGPDMRVAVSSVADPPIFSFDRKVGESTGGVNPGIRLAEDPRTGAMWVIWGRRLVDLGGGVKTMTYMVNRSTDGGNTWPLGGGSGVIAAVGDSTQPTPKFGTVNALLGGTHHANVDPTTGDLYYVYGKRDPGTGNDRLAIKKISSDGGGGLVLGTEHFVTGQVEAAVPQVAVLDNGVVGVFYYTFDGFSGDDFPIFTAHLALSEDEGASFTDYDLLTFLSSAQDSCPGDSCNRQRVLGDYMNMVNVGNCFYGSFTGNGAPFGRPVSNHDPIFFKTCVGPELSVPDQLSFGDVCQGDSVIDELNVCNTGTENLIVESIVPSDSQFTVTGYDFPLSISPDFCFPVDITYTPDSGVAVNADVVIVSNDDDSPTTVDLFGNSPLADINTFIADSGDFGEVCSGLYHDLNLTIQNDGACGLEIDNMSITGVNASDFDLPDGSFAGTIIEPGNSLLVPVRFAPANFTDPSPRTATVNVNSSTENGGNLATDQTPIQGTVPPPDINAWMADSGDFGAVCKGDFRDLDLNILNQGRCDLTISEINSFWNLVVVPDDLDLPLVLSPDASVQVPLRFAPEVCFDEPVVSAIQILSDDPDEGNVQIPISGVSPCPNLVIDPGALSGDFAFPATVVDTEGTLGCYSERTTVLRNSGDCPLTIGAIDAADADFTVMQPTFFPIILPSGEETLEVTVRFTPQAAGDPLFPDETLGLLTVTSDDPDASGEAELCGEGVTQSGIRVLATDITSGVPIIIDSVDSMTVKSKGKGIPGPINLQFTDVEPNMTTVCGNDVHWHLDLETLPA
ncbi:MAG: choice-of-anchor D domain-containing protein, partial [Gammaproteobacteria bacterium]|nr:choice-of-anchor D domain-containing protein [Gammaproteobacteria bacterium]